MSVKFEKITRIVYGRYRDASTVNPSSAKFSAPGYATTGTAGVLPQDYDDADDRDPNGLLPSQFCEQPAPEFDEDQRLRAAMIERALDDWRDVFERGRVLFERGPQSFGLEDAEELRDWLFGDSYGAGESAVMIPLAECCAAVGYEVADVRARALRDGDPARLDASIIAPRTKRKGGPNAKI